VIKSWDTTTDNWQRGIAWATFLYYRRLNVTEIAHGTVALVRRLSVGFLATASRRGTGRLVYWWRRESSRKSITSPPTNGASSSSSCPLSPYVRRSYVRSWDGFENRSRTHQRRHRQRDPSRQRAAGGNGDGRRGRSARDHGSDTQLRVCCDEFIMLRDTHSSLSCSVRHCRPDASRHCTRLNLHRQWTNPQSPKLTLSLSLSLLIYSCAHNYQWPL